MSNTKIKDWYFLLKKYKEHLTDFIDLLTKFVYLLVWYCTIKDLLVSKVDEQFINDKDIKNYAFFFFFLFFTEHKHINDQWKIILNSKIFLGNEKENFLMNNLRNKQHKVKVRYIDYTI